MIDWVAAFLLGITVGILFAWWIVARAADRKQESPRKLMPENPIADMPPR